jgi:hypothetical protein
MPDVKEVYEMVTQQTGPRRGAWNGSPRSTTGRTGAARSARSSWRSVYPVDPEAVEVSTGFVEAFGA